MIELDIRSLVSTCKLGLLALGSAPSYFPSPYWANPVYPISTALSSYLISINIQNWALDLSDYRQSYHGRRLCTLFGIQLGGGGLLDCYQCLYHKFSNPLSGLVHMSSFRSKFGHRMLSCLCFLLGRLHYRFLSYQSLGYYPQNLFHS